MTGPVQAGWVVVPEGADVVAAARARRRAGQQPEVDGFRAHCRQLLKRRRGGHGVQLGAGVVVVGVGQVAHRSLRSVEMRPGIGRNRSGRRGRRTARPGRSGHMDAGQGSGVRVPGLPGGRGHVRRSGAAGGHHDYQARCRGRDQSAQS